MITLVPRNLTLRVEPISLIFLGNCEYCRQPIRPLSPHGVNVARLDFQHLAIHEHDGGQRLFLCTRCDLAVNGQMCQKPSDRRSSQIRRMQPCPIRKSVESEESSHPIDIRRLGPNRVVQEPTLVPNSIQQPWFTCRQHFLYLILHFFSSPILLKVPALNPEHINKKDSWIF